MLLAVHKNKEKVKIKVKLYDSKKCGNVALRFVSSSVTLLRTVAVLQFPVIKGNTFFIKMEKRFHHQTTLFTSLQKSNVMPPHNLK